MTGLLDLLLAGKVDDPVQTVASPKEVVDLIRQLQRSGQCPRLLDVVDMATLGDIVAANSGWVVMRRVETLANLCTHLHTLPSRLKLLPFGGSQVWI